MTPKLKTLIGIAVVVAVIAGYFYTQVDWEARAIRQRLDSLAGLVEKDGPVSTFETLARGRRLAGVFTAGAEVEYVDGRRLPKDIDAMAGAFVSVWGRVEQASIRVVRHEVQVDPDRPEAESMLTARCSVVLGGAEQMGDTLKYKIHWRKIDGEWRIRSLFPVN